MTTITLHDYWRSSAAYRVRIALNLLGLDWVSANVDLPSGAQRSIENLARNPQGLVPTLEIDSIVLTQSLAIIEYLNETRQAGWLPDEALTRARVRTLAYSIAMDIHPVCNLRVARHAEAQGADIKEWMQHFITLGFDGIESLLSNGEDSLYCHGDRITIADICLVPQVYNARRWEIDLERFPNIIRIDANLTALGQFSAANPDRVLVQENACSSIDTRWGRVGLSAENPV